MDDQLKGILGKFINIRTDTAGRNTVQKNLKPYDDMMELLDKLIQIYSNV